MRKSLEDIIHESIILEYSLPNPDTSISNSSITSVKDFCYSGKNDFSLSEVIYNNIVEYAISEFSVDYQNIDTEQMRALATSLRYDATAQQIDKLKYGFYGEVLLHAILACKLQIPRMLARGYLYNPTSKSEITGYDSFHFAEGSTGNLELWFGEAKFYESHNDAIRKIFDKLDESLTNSYFNENFYALLKWENQISCNNSILKEIINDWIYNPKIVPAVEFQKRDVTLVIPLLVIFQKKPLDSYHDSIARCIKCIEGYIKRKYRGVSSFKTKLFFIFLPVDNALAIKESVIEWIETRKPLV